MTQLLICCELLSVLDKNPNYSLDLMAVRIYALYERSIRILISLAGSAAVLAAISFVHPISPITSSSPLAHTLSILFSGHCLSRRVHQGNLLAGVTSQYPESRTSTADCSPIGEVTCQYGFLVDVALSVRNLSASWDRNNHW